jgi:NADH dehydrogenase FAD-containing subunit
LSDSSHAHHVVIVGAGFGGLEVAHRLARAPVRITIVDQRNHHLFQPLLYQVADGFVSDLGNCLASPSSPAQTQGSNDIARRRYGHR